MFELTIYVDVACTVSWWQSSLQTAKYWFSPYQNHDKEEFSYTPYYFFQILFNQWSLISCRYQKQDSAVFCGSVLQFFAINFPCIAEIMISQSNISRKFDLAEEKDYLISGVAFSLLSDLLTKRKDMIETFLQEHQELFLERIESLMSSSNMLHRRHSMDLLYDVFILTQSYELIKAFVSKNHNLKLVMSMMNKKFCNVLITFTLFRVSSQCITSLWMLLFELYFVLIRRSVNLEVFFNKTPPFSTAISAVPELTGRQRRVGRLISNASYHPLNPPSILQLSS